MIPREALAVLELVEIEWPNADRLSDETKKAWAFELLDFEIEPAREAVRELARFQKFRPALSELLDACEEQRRARRVKFALASTATPLTGEFMSFSDWLKTHATPEQVEAAKRLSPSLAKDLG